MIEFTDESPPRPAESDVFSTSDRTRHVDRWMELLADRRRRFCCYHLQRASEPLGIRDLAVLVEASVSPPGTSIPDRIREEAVRRLVTTHLPKLQDAGLVRVQNGQVDLESDPAVPIGSWLSATAAVELDTPEPAAVRRNDHRSTDRSETDSPGAPPSGPSR